MAPTALWLVEEPAYRRSVRYRAVAFTLAASIGLGLATLIIGIHIGSDVWPVSAAVALAGTATRVLHEVEARRSGAR